MFTGDVERNQINSEQQIYTLPFQVIQMLQKHNGVSHTDMGTSTVERSRVKEWNIPNHLILIESNNFSDSKDRKTQSSRKCRRLTNGLRKQLLEME